MLQKVKHCFVNIAYKLLISAVSFFKVDGCVNYFLNFITGINILINAEAL